MGQQSIYIFPRESSPTDFFCERAVEKLSAAGLILPEPTRAVVDFAEFYAGDRAADFLSERFEYLGIRKGPLARLLPEDPSIEPECPRCQQDLHEEYYDCVNEACEIDETQDWSLLRVACPKCGWEGRLDELRDDVGVFLRNEYVFFSDVNISQTEFARLEREIALILGDVMVKLYWFT